MIIYANSNHQIYRCEMNDNDNDFNDRVLEYIKETQPDGTLDELLDEMKALSPDEPCSMHQLNQALQYSDAVLRTDPDYIDYTSEYLDKKSIHLLGVNSLLNDMIYKTFLQEKENEDDLL